MNAETRVHIAVVRWWALACRAEKLDERTLLHFANGGKRGKVEGAIFKGMGLRAGAPDLVLIVPRGECCGLAMELKAPGGRLSIEQAQMLNLFESQHWAKVICWSFEEAIGAIVRYLRTGNPLLIK